MISEQEKRATLNKMSDLEYQKNDTEMMRYRVNGLSHKLGLLGIAFATLASFFCLNSMNPNNINVLVMIGINIAILLLGFLFCENAKNYSARGCISLIVLGGVSAASMFYIPVILLANYSTYVSQYNIVKDTTKTAQEINAAKKVMESAKLNLGETITSYYEGNTAVSFLGHDGNVRAIFAMIFFAAGAALFIAAGVIGYLRSMKLSRYLDSIKEKN